MKVEERLVDLGYAQIQCYLFGNGKRQLFMLPGWPFSGQIYLLMQHYLEKKFRVVTCDFPGWSGKSKFVGEGEYSVLGYTKIATDVFGCFFGGQKNITIVGCSVGGVIALLCAQKVHHQVKRLIMQAPPFNGTEFCKDKKVRPILIQLGLHIPPLATLLKTYYKYYAKYIIANKNNAPININKELIAKLEDSYRNLLPKATLQFAVDFFGFDAYRLIDQSLVGKISVVVGKEDCHVPPSSILKLLTLTQAKLFTIENSDHFLPGQKPAEFAHIINSS